MTKKIPDYSPYLSAEQHYGEIICTDRDIESVKGNLGFKSSEEFFSWLKDKKVLNIGAGMMKLEKDILNEHSEDVGDMEMISMEPRLSREKFRSKHALPENQKISSVAAVWDEHLSLPFADGSFDRVLSTWAFPYYTKKTETLKNVFREIDRITTDNCEIRLSPASKDIDLDEALKGTRLKYKFLKSFIGYDCVLFLYK